VHVCLAQLSICRSEAAQLAAHTIVHGLVPNITGLGPVSLMCVVSNWSHV
jgi:hypothetical protein